VLEAAEHAVDGLKSMPQVRFKGRVLPDYFRVSLGSPMTLSRPALDIGLDISFTIDVRESVIGIDCVLSRSNPRDINHIYVRVADLANAVVNMIAFGTGLGLTAVLESFTDPNGTDHQLRVEYRKLAQFCTAFRLGASQDDDDFAQIYELVLENADLMWALNDLIQAITLPHAVPVNCGRVIDSIRLMITPSARKKKAGWDQMQRVLRADQAYLKFISDHSEHPRHGARAPISGPITMEILERTWTVMNRFLEFRKRGSQPLSPSNFPLLRG
jgi:hypothetical protein